MPNSSMNHRDASTGCVLFAAHRDAGLYQRAARAAFEIAGDVDLQPHAWITATCGNACLDPQHLIAHQPRAIAYPAGVCVYCGLPAGTKDHLVPRTWTGDTRRNSVAVVPACAECNTRIGSSGSASIDDRRKIAHDGIRKSKRETLDAPDWTPEALAELGPALRQHVMAKQRAKQATLARLAWPEDPFYDMRAWQKSGIDDPASLGVIANPVGYVAVVPAPTRTAQAVRAAEGRVDARERLALGSRLRRARTVAGITQSEVAQLMRSAGFTNWVPTTVCGTELGRRRLSKDERAELERLLCGPEC